MAYANLIWEQDGDVLTIRLSRPHRLNAMNEGLIADLEAALEAAGRDEGIRAVILTGEGRAFCAGEDLREGLTPAGKEEDQAALRRALEILQRLTRLIRGMPKAVIAAVNGYALGGGCELAVACDIVLAAEEARFGFPEVGLGLAVTGGVTHILPRLVGIARAKELILSGEMVNGRRAAEMGLANRAVPLGDLIPAARELARRLAAKAPLSVRAAKAGLDLGSQVDLEGALRLEVEAAMDCMTSEDAREGKRAFEEKRPPRFHGR